MHSKVAANGSRRREAVKGTTEPEDIRADYFLIESYDVTPAFTVDGIPPLPGENWRDYHARALAWITIEAATIPANTRFMSRFQFLARLLAIPLILTAWIALASEAA
jgi:hypothetical protein